MFSKNDKIKKVSKCSIIALFLTFLIVGGGTVESTGATEEERVSKLIEGAKQEGQVVLYTNSGIADGVMMVKGFQEKYPFLKVQTHRATGAAFVAKVVGEARAKIYVPDVIEVAGFQTYVINKEGLYASYVSPESRFYREGFKDPKGNWTSNYVLPMVMGYNTKLLSRKDIPDTYEGFLNPRWKGKKIGFDTKEVEGFANMLKVMGEEKGMDFFKKFVAQQLHYRQGHTLITNLMLAGEFPVGTVFPHAVEVLKKKGAPVDWVAVWPVIAKLTTVGLTAHAPHPNAAKLYIDFVLSREGQMMLASVERLPARPDVADGLQAYKGLKMYPSDLSLAENFTTYSKQFADLLR